MTTEVKTNPLLKLTSDFPTYTLELPVSGKKIKYRPFLVKEQKILLLALENVREHGQDDGNAVLESVVSVLDACLITPKQLNVRELPLLDVEYFFLQLRGKSVGEDIELIVPDYTGENEEEKLPDLEHKMDIEKIEIKRHEGHTDTIKISNDSITVQMTPPTLENCNDIFFGSVKETTVEQTFDILASCIKSVATEGETFFAEDLSTSEIKEFVESLGQDDYLKLTKYFETLPSMLYQSEAKSPVTGKTIRVEITEFADFFV